MTQTLLAVQGQNQFTTWQPSTVYAKNAQAFQAGVLYTCQVAHTSASTWAADAVNWTISGQLAEPVFDLCSPTYGAVGGSDICAALIQALSDASTAGGGTVLIRASTSNYILAAGSFPINIPAGCAIEAQDGATLDASSAPDGITLFASTGSETQPDPVTKSTTTGLAALTSTANPGDTVLHLASTTGMAAGNVCKLSSNRPYDCYYGGIPGGCARYGELVTILSVDSGTQVTLRDKIAGGPYYATSGPAGLTTTLNGAIGSGAGPLTIPVNLNATFPSGGWIVVDQEVFFYTATTVDASTGYTSSFLNATRAQTGTTLATHSNGATVTQVPADQPIAFFTADPGSGGTTLSVTGPYRFPKVGKVSRLRSSASATRRTGCSTGSICEVARARAPATACRWRTRRRMGSS